MSLCFHLDRPSVDEIIKRLSDIRALISLHHRIMLAQSDSATADSYGQVSRQDGDLAIHVLLMMSICPALHQTIVPSDVDEMADVMPPSTASATANAGETRRCSCMLCFARLC